MVGGDGRQEEEERRMEGENEEQARKGNVFDKADARLSILVCIAEIM